MKLSIVIETGRPMVTALEGTLDANPLCEVHPEDSPLCEVHPEDSPL